MDIIIQIGNSLGEAIYNDKILLLMVYAIVFDIVFGTLRACKERKFNSTVGINGMIRKCGMILAIIFLIPVDSTMGLNLIGFIPDPIKEYANLSAVGLSELFALFFLCYEVTSILKNMVLCDLPVKTIWDKVYGFLSKYTSELPDTDEIEEKK